MNLSDVFSHVVYKQLVPVDLRGSHQHELNGVVALKEFFGTAGTSDGTLKWHYFADDEEPTETEDRFTFYDARARSADRTGRSEWRLYYYGDFILRANAGDSLFLARAKSGELSAMVFQQGSAWLRVAHVLFGVKSSSSSFDAIRSDELDTKKIELLRRQILNELGVEVVVPVRPTDQELMLEKYNRVFPTTKQLSEFARTQIEVDFSRPDDVLVRWLEREEQLFRALENVIIRERLDSGFKTVDDFIQYSLSVQNRRKSRMGHALQNHLGEIFSKCGLRFKPQAKTEGNNRPDFLFPGEVEYHNPSFDSKLLVMLGVKSSSKDRWRQILTEADRIESKHLCTLEAGISIKQTDEMKRQRLTLILPLRLHETYTKAQQSDILSIAEFIQSLQRKQNDKFKL